MARGAKTQSGQQLPALCSYIDDVMTFLQTATCTTRPLKRFEELLSWARMRIKPSKSCSFSIMSGARRKELVITEVTRTEEEQYKIKDLTLTWSTGPLVAPMCERFPEPGLSFLIRFTYNTLPNPSNLFSWYCSEKSCKLCCKCFLNRMGMTAAKFRNDLKDLAEEAKHRTGFG